VFQIVTLVVYGTFVNNVLYAGMSLLSGVDATTYTLKQLGICQSRLETHCREQQSFYNHQRRQSVLAISTLVKNWRIFLQQSFTAHIPLLTAFRL